MLINNGSPAAKFHVTRLQTPACAKTGSRQSLVVEKPPLYIRTGRGVESVSTEGQITHRPAISQDW